MTTGKCTKECDEPRKKPCFGMEGCRHSFTEKTVEDYLKYKPAELRFKRKFLTAMIIKPLQENEDWKEDPRQPKALEYYLGLRNLINAALHMKMYGENGPPSQNIGMKPVRLAGKNKR